jgi:hypothetical protein
MFLLATILIFSTQVFAQETNRTPTPEEQKHIQEYEDAISGKDHAENRGPVVEPSKNPPKGPEEVKGQTESHIIDRTHFLGAFDYSPFDLVIPSKFGATAGYIVTKHLTFEVEYLYGGLALPFIAKDLGKMTDQRLSLMARSFFGKSFNLHYGVSYMPFQIKLGNAFIDRSVPHASEFNEIVLNTFGFNVGIGNRFVFSDTFIAGIDWISWSQPLSITSVKDAFADYASDADRKNIEDAIRLISKFPRISVLKLYIGMTF